MFHSSLNIQISVFKGSNTKCPLHFLFFFLDNLQPMDQYVQLLPAYSKVKKVFHLNNLAYASSNCADRGGSERTIFNWGSEA